MVDCGKWGFLVNSMGTEERFFFFYFLLGLVFSSWGRIERVERMEEGGEWKSAGRF